MRRNPSWKCRRCGEKNSGHLHMCGYCLLWRAAAILALIAVATVAFAQENLPPGHVHSYAGQALVMSLPDGRITLALGNDSLVEHLFTLQTESKEAAYFRSDAATVEYWHDKLVLRAPRERTMYVFTIGEHGGATESPLRAWTVYGYRGIGLAHQYDMDFELPLTEADVAAFLDRGEVSEKFGDPYHQKPPGGGGGSGFCAPACSYTCAHGTATATCTPSPPYCAQCQCNGNGTPNAYCYNNTGGGG